MLMLLIFVKIVSESVIYQTELQMALQLFTISYTILVLLQQKHYEDYKLHIKN